MESILALSLQIAVLGLQALNRERARKYIDDLVELQKEVLEMEAKPVEEVDDVTYVAKLKEIHVLLEAVRNDPSLHSLPS